MKKLNKERALKTLTRDTNDKLILPIPKEDLYTGHVPDTNAWLNAHPLYRQWRRAMTAKYGHCAFTIELSYDIGHDQEYIIVRRERPSSLDPISLKHSRS